MNTLSSILRKAGPSLVTIDTTTSVSLLGTPKTPLLLSSSFPYPISCVSSYPDLSCRLSNQSLASFDEDAKKTAEFLEKLKEFEGAFEKTEVDNRLNFLVLKESLTGNLEVRKQFPQITKF
jgi:hypothetical protein